MKKEKILINNLEMTFPNGVKALKGVSLKVFEGEFLSIIGLSGSGKSTLLRSINRLNTPTGGEILYKNQNVLKSKGKEISILRSNVAMIFQKFNLVGRHSVLSNVLMGALSRTGFFASLVGAFSKEDIDKAHEYLKLVGLEEKAQSRADQLSGGQQQRVAIARTLMQDPDVLLADEPVASLDPALSHTIMDYLKKINQDLGITVLCNLHHLDLVKTYSDRAIALKDGVLVFEGSPEQINEKWFKEIYGEEARQV